VTVSDDTPPLADRVAAQVAVAPQPSAPRKRRRGLIGLVVVLVVVVLIAIAAVVVDGVARGAIRDEVADRVRTVLELEPDHPVDVEVAGASVLLQAAAGRFERVTVDAGEIAAGDLRGSLEIAATGIPTDLTQPADRVEATFTVAETDLPAIAGALSNAEIEDVVLEEGEIRFRSALDLLGIPLQFAVGLVPEAVDGALAFTPSTLTINDEQLDLAQFAEQFGGLGDGLLATQTVCVAEQLPRDLVLESVDVGDEALVIRLGADDAVLDGPGFTERGGC
jgi:hypothetical protein